jgi:hypothetical protein
MNLIAKEAKNPHAKENPFGWMKHKKSMALVNYLENELHLVLHV